MVCMSKTNYWSVMSPRITTIVLGIGIFFTLICAYNVLSISSLLSKVYYSLVTHSAITSRYLFVQNLPNFTCDDLFTGTILNGYNFSEKYHKDFPAFVAEIKRVAGGMISRAGYTAVFPPQHKTLHYLASKSDVKSVCETGFNYGHSAFTYATAKSKSKILSFDIASHNYTKSMMEYLKKTYVGRFTGIIGDSFKTLPKFVTENPFYKCDMFFIDGSHTYETSYSDLNSFSKMAEKDNIVVFDDYPTLHGGSLNTLGKAWEQAKREGMVKETMRCTRKKDRLKGFSMGKFI